MSLFIRYATKDDAALIADISRQTFYDTFAADNTPEDMEKFLGEQFTKGRLMLEVGSQGNEFLLGCKNERVAGYVKLREAMVPAGLRDRNLLEIARLYVLKEFIGEGIGALLMQRSIEIANQKGKEAVWLGVWEKNQRAIDFYHKFGFEKFGECDFLLGNDLQRDWLMKKELR